MAEKETKKADGIETAEKRLYEVGILFMPTLTEEELSREVGLVREAIEERGGAVISEEWPVRKDLAYRMYRDSSKGKVAADSAYFGWMRFETLPEVATQLSEVLNEQESIIRSLLFSTKIRNIKPRRRSSMLSRKTTPKEPVATIAKETTTASTGSDEIDKEIEKLIVE